MPVNGSRWQDSTLRLDMLTSMAMPRRGILIASLRAIAMPRLVTRYRSGRSRVNCNVVWAMARYSLHVVGVRAGDEN